LSAKRTLHWFQPTSANDPGRVKTVRGISTRNFGLYDHAENKKPQKFVFRSALRPNQISFLHCQDSAQTLARTQGDYNFSESIAKLSTSVVVAGELARGSQNLARDR
jgi:hypothetical protein